MADFFDNKEKEFTAVPLENEEERADPFLVKPELLDNTNEDVAILRKKGYGGDDHSDPASINIPIPASKYDKVKYHEWGSISNTCYQQS